MNKNLNHKAIENTFLSPDTLEVWEQTPEEQARARAFENFFNGKRPQPKEIDIYEHDLNQKDFLGQF